MYKNPADYIISVFGGVRKTARAVGRSAASVSKWPRPKATGGCDGYIPGGVHQKILSFARTQKLDITADDLLFGRTILSKNKKRLSRHKSINNAKYGQQKIVAEQIQKSGKVCQMSNTQWFLDRINTKFGSLRQFSKQLIGKNGKSLDVSAVSLMLRGKREMRYKEAHQIAKLLEEPLIEVFENWAGETIHA